MSKRHGLVASCSAIGAILVSGSAMAELVLQVDLTVVDQVTITATDGLSAATVSGDTFTGFYLAQFFTSSDFTGSHGGSGDLTAASVVSDSTPSLFSAGSSSGLNVWSYSATATTTFTTGELAFTGSGTWALSSDDYALFIAGNTHGDVYFPADSDDDLGGASVIGQWSVIPAPSALAMLGLAGLGARHRRR